MYNDAKKGQRKMTKIQINPNKAKERSFLFRVLFCFLLCTAALFIIYASVGGRLFTFYHLIIFILCCIPLSIIYALFIEKIGNGFGALMSGWSNKKIPLKEQYSADMSRARFCKSRKEYSEALNIINEILENIPAFPEALFLKAQILWEGFKNSKETSTALDRALELVKDDEPFRKRVSNYYMLLIKNEGDTDVS